ncbi:hypothetical protein B4168_2757 [Anoxybacillus flavithermus]|nr:hypothetical protein B4168_2757 [Anoxybacillus flavithermus]OAO87524.1 hypothetical protein GT23_1173 [Parageobacillus thermoglucosidasius]
MKLIDIILRKSLLLSYGIFIVYTTSLFLYKKQKAKNNQFFH